MGRRLPLQLLFLGLSLALGVLAAGKNRQLVLDVNSPYVQKAAKYAISKIACPCAATHGDNHEHHQLEMTDIKSAEVLFGDEQNLLKISGHVHTEHETETHAHDCSFYLHLKDKEVTGLKEYTCSKYLEGPSKKRDVVEILQPKELLALETFAKTALANYNKELMQILATSKKYGKDIVYILRLFVRQLNKAESKFRECKMRILYEPWTSYKYSLITDSCH